MINKGFDWINNLTPAEVRSHLTNIRKLSQSSNIRFWESLSIIESLLESKGLAELNPKTLEQKLIETNNNFLRKENKK